MKIRNKIIASAMLVMANMAGNNVLAEQSWYISTSVSTMPAIYTSSDQRNGLTSNSLLLDMAYLDVFGVTFFYNNSIIDFKKVNGVDNDITQDAFAGRIHYRFFSDALNGAITPQLVVHSISNNDVTSQSDGVSVIAPKLAYLNNAKNFYLDVEYSLSTYANNSNLEITQWSTAVGIGFNQNSDWLSIKPYFILSSDKTLSQGEDSLSSVDVKWTHWFGPNNLLGMKSLYFNVLSGQRIFAVDNGSFAVYNLADVQEGSFSSGASWAFGDAVDFLAIIGSEKYKNKTINNSYSQNYLYLGLNKRW